MVTFVLENIATCYNGHVEAANSTGKVRQTCAFPTVANTP